MTTNGGSKTDDGEPEPVPEQVHEGQVRGKVPRDAAHDALAHEYRRRAIEFLLETDGNRASLDDLIDHIARASSPLSGGANVRERIRVAVHHNHLPRIEEVGFVVYDEDRNVVRLTERGKELETWL